MDLVKWNKIQVGQLEPNRHNNPISLYFTSIPRSWPYKGVVIARALTNTKIGLALEEFDHIWGDRPIDWWYKVPVWKDDNDRWWVRLYDSMYFWYELQQPGMKVGVLPVGTEGLLLVVHYSSLNPNGV